METHEIRYFLATVRELNFTRAAAACGITQPALTRAIQKLEAELGGDLFLRRPGKIELTRLAREVLPLLEQIEQSMADVRARASAVVEQRYTALRLGVMCTVGPTHIVTILSQLRAAIPDLELSISDATSREIVAMIAGDQIDVGLAAWPIYPEQVQSDILLTERFALAMPANDPWKNQSAIALPTLAGQSYIDRLGCEFDDYFQMRHGKWEIDVDVFCESEREDWTQSMIRAGFGYAIVPEHMPLIDGLITRPLCSPEVVREVSVLTLRGKQLSPAASMFVQLAKSHSWLPNASSTLEQYPIGRDRFRDQ